MSDLGCALNENGHLMDAVSMLLTTVLLMYIYTACWLNNYVVQLCPFWCNSYGARLSRLLTDALQIVFYNDPGDNTPISGPALMATTLDSSTMSSWAIHPFFSGAPSPAIFVTVSCHSTHVPHPSTHITDPNNAEASTSTAATSNHHHKHKVDNIPSGRHVSCKIIIDSDTEDGDAHNLESVDDSNALGDDYTGSEGVGVGDPTDIDEDDAETAYAFTKGMGDADRQVHFSDSFASLSNVD